jgi:tetratricopeptide (TPR) repeat protein
MYKKSISLFEKSENAHNNDKTFSKYNWYYIGLSYLNLGNYKKAAFYFNKYLTLMPRDNLALLIVGTCCEALHEPEIALQSCQKALENGADSIALHVEIAKILKKIDRKEEALEHLHKAEVKSTNVNQKAIIKSMICWVEDKLEEAINTLKQVISKTPHNSDNSKSLMKADIYLMLSGFQKEFNDTSGSLATLETAVTLYPDDPEIMNGLAFDYAEQEIKLDKADRLITSALEFQPENSFFLDTKGWILHKMGKSVEAEKVITESMKLNPKSKAILEHLNTIQRATR